MMGEVSALRRCATQPIPRDEVDDLPKTTIAERLAALRKNGDSNWMKRIVKPSAHDEIVSTKPPSGGGSRVTERLGQLETASQGWKARVGTPDAAQFTVAGKMSDSLTLVPAPKLGSASRKPSPAVFTHKGVASASTPSVPDSLAALMKRSISVSEGEEIQNADSSCVKVPEPFDEDFSSFFANADLSQLKSDLDVDFEDILLTTTPLNVQKKNIRIQRKYRSTNPLKALAQRTDLKSEYVEVKTGVADREIRRMNIEKLTKNCGLAVEALAGLASKEDITAVALKKPMEGSPATRQWSHPLLLRVKGRRHPLTTIVRPHYTSINQGDAFVLVNSNKVFLWTGEFSNVIEKSRSTDVANHIQTHKDLGYTGFSPVILLEGSPYPNSTEKSKEFWSLLQLPEELMSIYSGDDAGHPSEDEVYEKAVSDTYLVYSLEDDKLVPVEAYWGRCPKIEVLNPSKVLVFDFGSEVYTWTGKHTDRESRRSGSQLAQDLFKKGLRRPAWTPTAIQWLDQEMMDSSERPQWSIQARVTQHMEPIIFKEKFLDWPDFTRVIQTKTTPQDRQVDGSVEARPCNVNQMLDWSIPAPDLVLEGVHLGRGVSYYDEDRMLHYDVTTKEIQVWNLGRELNLELLNPSSLGHFQDDESYVIRWKYCVAANARELSGLPSKHSDAGRDRTVNFVWHGRCAPVVEQGAAALLISSDPSFEACEGPLVTVQQGSEVPAFGVMFPGPVVFHNSTYREEGRRLFLISGEEDEEVRLDEVKYSPTQLRSRGNLFFINTVIGTGYLWHGCRAPRRNKRISTDAVQFLRTNPHELGLSEFVSELVVEEIEEGNEPDPFFGGCDAINRESYGSLLNGKEIDNYWTPRLYHLSSLHGDFTANPVPSQRVHPDHVTPYPYSKEDLYTASQPALFLLDVDSSLWLWCGWNEGDTDTRGSVWIRHTAERIAALTTALSYWDRRGKSASDVFEVFAGLEPPQFKSLFSIWAERLGSRTGLEEIARNFNIEEGHFDCEIRSVQEELRIFEGKTYPLSELTAIPPPAGVDPTRLEEYLSDEEFKEVLGVTRTEFSELPPWKRTNLKKAAHLF